MFGPAVLLVLVAALASLFMAWVIGAGSSGATPFAPAVGADAISVMRAAFLVGLLGFAGAVLQGASVSETVGGGLVDGVTLPPVAVVLVLLTAAGLMTPGIRTGYPIATAFTVTGAVIGTGLALGGSPAWGTYAEIAALWLFVPVVNGGIAYGLASALPRDDVPETLSVPALAFVTAAVVTAIRFSFLGPPGATRSIGEAVARAVAVPSLPVAWLVALVVGTVAALVLRRALRRSEERGLHRFLLALGSLVAFSAGASQVGLAVGPVFPLFDGIGVPALLVLFGGGVGILAGSWTGAPRMIKALSQDYASLGPRRSISALLPSFLMAQAAVLLGVPVSFNEIVVSAIVGSSAAVNGREAVDAGKLGWTAVGWVVSFAVAFGVGYGVFTLA